jgi:hypothetical protein
MLTRKHYIEVAARYKDKKPTYSEFLKIWREEVESLCNMFKRDNPRFDETRFKTACNY